jgi:hypothetical protein
LAIRTGKQTNIGFYWRGSVISLANWASNIMIMKSICTHLPRPPSPLILFITISVLNFTENPAVMP